MSDIMYDLLSDRPIATNRVGQFINNNIGQWFNQRSTHFLGENSNY